MIVYKMDMKDTGKYIKIIFLFVLKMWVSMLKIYFPTFHSAVILIF